MDARTVDPLIAEARAYEFLVGALSNPALRSQFFPQLTEEGKKTIAQIGFASDEQAEVLLQILQMAAFSQANNQEAIKANAELMIQSTKETFRVVTATKDALVTNMTQTSAAYHKTMWMYIISFYTGIALIGFAILFAWMGIGGGSHLPAIFSGLGTTNMLAFFFTKPPEGLQRSRASLAQLQSAFLAWYSDFYNGNVMMAQLQGSGTLNQASFKDLSNDLLNRTERWMAMLQNAVQQTHGSAKPKAPNAE